VHEYLSLPASPNWIRAVGWAAKLMVLAAAAWLDPAAVERVAKAAAVAAVVNDANFPDNFDIAIFPAIAGQQVSVEEYRQAVKLILPPASPEYEPESVIFADDY
jgi:hypothetical protein